MAVLEACPPPIFSNKPACSVILLMDIPQAERYPYVTSFNKLQGRNQRRCVERGLEVACSVNKKQVLHDLGGFFQPFHHRLRIIS